MEDKLKKFKSLFSKKSKKQKDYPLPSVEKVKEIKKDVDDTMRNLNRQNRIVAQKLKEKTHSEDTIMNKDIDCMSCKKFGSLLKDKQKLNSLTDKQKQGAQIAYKRCGRCKSNYCDTNTFETIDDLELCSMITHVLDDQEIMELLEIIN